MIAREFYLFPYEMIPQNSKVIIYAMGNVGRCYWEQIKNNNYCRIVACADKNADNGINTKFNMISPAELKEYEYEYLIIAVESDGLAGRIIYDLVNNYGVREEKCVFRPNSKVYTQKVIIKWGDALRDRSLMCTALSDFWNRDCKVEEYFADWISCILKSGGEEEKKYILSFLNDSYRNNILIFRILYACDLLDSELFEQYISNILKVQNADHRIWNLYDISVIERDNQTMRYPNFYTDKRSLIDSLFKNINIDNKKIESNHKFKVAVVPFDLRGEKSSHNALVIPYANEMSRQGVEVGIFPMDLMKYRYGESFIRPIESIDQNSEYYEEYHKTVLNDTIQVFYPKGESISERAQNILNNLISYSPDVVFDFCGEYSFLSAKIKELFKVIAIPMRGYCSSSVFDLYFCRNFALCKKENEVYHSVEESQMVESLVCSEPVKQIKEFKRTDYGFAPSSFIITTVGSRLHSEITNEFCKEVCAFLEENEDAYWIMVGERYPRLNDAFEQFVEKGRIIKWGYESDLIGFYNGICDVYWNPDRMGAGGSIGSAMRCGLPVITTCFPSDVLPRLGIENAVDGDYKDCRAMVQRLHDDKQFYKEKSELMKSRMTISGITEYVHLLIEKAMEISR